MGKEKKRTEVPLETSGADAQAWFSKGDDATFEANGSGNNVLARSQEERKTQITGENDLSIHVAPAGMVVGQLLREVASGRAGQDKVGSTRVLLHLREEIEGLFQVGVVLVLHVQDLRSLSHGCIQNNEIWLEPA